MKEFTEKNKRALILLDSLQNLSYNQKREILQTVEEPYQLLDGLNDCPQIFSQLSALGITVITYLDQDYPNSFLQLKEYPLCLYCKGKVELLREQEGLAIIGSRKTLSVALEFTRNLAKSLSDERVIITGTTSGVEKTVTVATGGKNTVCFCACGIDEQIKKNPDEILTFCETGLLVSAFAISVKERGYHYIERNKLIAKFCQEAVVVSADFSSGVRYTAEYLMQDNKKIYALPYTVGEPSGRLCNQLIKQGASILFKIEDLTESQPRKQVYTENEQLVLNLIKHGINSVDKIVEQSGITASEVFTTLVSLEIKDSIIKSGADEYALTEF